MAGVLRCWPHLQVGYLSTAGEDRQKQVITGGAPLPNYSTLSLASVEATTLEGGLRSISIKRIPDLVFGEQTRIYKIAVLQATDQNPVGVNES